MSNNDITGDALKSRPNSKAFDENFDKIFGKKKICRNCNGFGWFKGCVGSDLIDVKCRACDGTGQVLK